MYFPIAGKTGQVDFPEKWAPTKKKSYTIVLNFTEFHLRKR